MAQAHEQLPQIQTQLEELNNALSGGEFAPVRRMLKVLSVGEIADLVEFSPPKTRTVLWQLIDKEREGEVLSELNETIQSEFLKDLDTEEVVELTDGLDSDDIADILQQLPSVVRDQVLKAMSAQDRNRVERVLDFDEETAGGIMDTDTITVRPRFTLDVVLRYLRRHEQIPPMTDAIYVVNRDDKFVGVLPISKILISDPHISVREIMDTEVNPIPAEMDDGEVASLFEKNDWVSAPVVDGDGTLLGRITIDDVVDVIIEDADKSLLNLAGLDEEEDTFATVRKTTPRRAMWLGINLLTVFVAAAVIKQFEATIEQIVALAVLMPIVPSMGGIAGSQTLTLVIRGMATGQIGQNNQWWLVTRELTVGLINGLLFALAVGAVAYAAFGDTRLGLIIGIAMVINLVTAALAGAVLPLSLKRLSIDPALAGGVVLTTITDVVGFLSFLGLAAWFYF
jgi:magnesium transporter